MAPKTTGRRLVIVESPTKATKIASFLGDGYIVESSRGHVRDLPERAADIPAKYKGEAWARTGVNIDADFAPLYVVSDAKKGLMRQLKAELADVDELLLATDGDREGEAIAWHLMEELKPKVPARRMVFHEITPEAIAEAVAHPRELDDDLVNAYQTRRVLDRLYGYEVSPVLWKKVMPNSSAGRVQSVATRLVVQREQERIAFRTGSFWDLDAVLDAGAEADPPTFAARLTQVGERRIAQGRDFDSRGELQHADTLEHLDQAAAEALAGSLRQGTFAVASVESKPYTRRPYAPFRTTTMQQEAGRKLGYSAQRAMSVAQDLYEQGFITYMRTDSVTLSDTAVNAARTQVSQLFGDRYLPPAPRVYTSKVKNAQEAHEAIRPAGETFLTPAQTGLHGDQFRLYELIWMRTVASQMNDAVGESISVRINADLPAPVQLGSGPVQSCSFTASGRTITFYGFLKAYVESHDDSDEAQSDDAQTRLPRLAGGQSLLPDSVTASGHETRPPARYTEPSLVAKLEELEIGRPSTYASIIATLFRRDYVFKRGSALVPTWLAFAITRLLEANFAQLVDYAFTAYMEEILDAIANGEAERVEVLHRFYFGDADTTGLRQLVDGGGEIDARANATFALGDLDSGIVVRVGRNGAYLEDDQEHRANVPEDLAPDELTVDLARELLSKPIGEERALGNDPGSGNLVVARNGRYGPYVTEVLGEDAPKNAKPRTGSLFASMSVDSVELESAMKLLSLPRQVGTDPQGLVITAQNGRYGPYLTKADANGKNSDTRSLASEDEIFTITLEQAEALFAEPKRGRGRGVAKPPLAELGDDPASGKPMVVKEGRFGPYVTDGETNATLRRGDEPESITPERGAELLAEKRAKVPAPKKRAAKKAPARKTAAKKTAAKKAPAKKAPAKKAPDKVTAESVSSDQS